MKIRYTLPASRQLDTILTYVQLRSPQGGGNLIDRIDGALALVVEHRGLAARRTGQAFAASS